MPRLCYTSDCDIPAHQFARMPQYPGYDVWCSQCANPLPPATYTELSERYLVRSIGSYCCLPCQERFHHCRFCQCLGPWSNYRDTLIRAGVLYEWHSPGPVHVCENCFSDRVTFCYRCDCAVQREDARYAADTDSLYCEACFSRLRGFTCSQCGDSYTGSRNSGDDVCTSCDDDSDRHDSDNGYGLIRDYGHTRAHSRFGSAPDGIWFGVELEVSVHRTDRTEAADHAMTLFPPGFVEFKEDGSIDYGFEIVSQPASLTYHRETGWKRFLEAVPKGIDSWRTGSCGMHVHVSRRPLTKLQIAKMAAFLSEDATRDFVVAVAGRDGNGYCAAEKKGKLSAYARGTQRYVALNLTNSQTVEFRIFRGTIRQQSFFKNLEFCHALTYFCAKVGCRELTVPRFAKYVRRYRRTYPALAEWMVRHGYMPAFTRQRPQGTEDSAATKKTA